MHPADQNVERRRLLMISLVGGASVAGGLAACQAPERDGGRGSAPKGGAEGGEEGVSAVEDLMREHGVLRRLLNAYDEVAMRLTAPGAKVDPSALVDAAALFREFGEDYHERGLEEQYVFPALRKAGGEGGGLVDNLLAQHQRGREITDYIHQTARSGAITSGSAGPLGDAIRSMTRMYNAHATWEDTVVFPAWKEAIAPAQLHDLAETFEELEHKQFGEDGFDEALRRVRSIEERLGLGDLGQFTAPSVGGPPS